MANMGDVEDDDFLVLNMGVAGELLGGIRQGSGQAICLALLLRKKKPTWRHYKEAHHMEWKRIERLREERSGPRQPGTPRKARRLYRGISEKGNRARSERTKAETLTRHRADLDRSRVRRATAAPPGSRRPWSTACSALMMGLLVLRAADWSPESPPLALSMARACWSASQRALRSSSRYIVQRRLQPDCGRSALHCPDRAAW